MKSVTRYIYLLLDKVLLRIITRILYKECPDNHTSLELLRLAIFQKFFGFNRSVPWPVHPSSTVQSWKKIKRKDRKLNPGCSIGNYIQATNGIEFGVNVYIGPNVVIISSNHEIADYSQHTTNPPIRIGNNVWIGANSVILPGITIGDNVVIGAGSIVTTPIPDNSIAVGNPCVVIRKKPSYQGMSDDF